ncbi:MAG: hypothetical protein IAI50_09755 [Candidatus Eremiobacteraeota bacterium]|nr:hypothetical protein [Candidatus Eremiobacteraeota bacterium]
MNVRLVSRFACSACFGALLLTSCGSKNTAILLGGHIAATPDPLNLSGIGASYAGTIVVTDTGYSGTISVATTCMSGTTPVAQISPTSGSAPFGIKVTPQNTGTCTLTYTDPSGIAHASVVNVTVSGIGVTSRSRN